MSRDVGCRCGFDLAFLQLWCGPAATAPFLTPSLGTSICRGCSPKKTQSHTKIEGLHGIKMIQVLSFLFSSSSSFFSFQGPTCGISSSQAMGQIGAAAASLHQSHNNTRTSRICKLRCSLRQCQKLTPLNEARDFFFFFFFLAFGFWLLAFQGCICGIWKFLGQESNWSSSCWPMPQPQQCRVQAMSVTYTTAHTNMGSLTH